MYVLISLILGNDATLLLLAAMAAFLTETEGP